MGREKTEMSLAMCYINQILADFFLGEKLKGSLLKGIFDKRVRIDLPVPLSVPTPLPSHPLPTSPYFPQESH